VPSANCRYGAEEQTTDHILLCPLYHPQNGALGLVALDDDTVDWHKTTHSISGDKIGPNEEENGFLEK